MDPGRWRRISRLYHEALERPVGERRAFIDVACSGDESLRRDVESLLEGGLEAGVKLGTYQIVRPLGRGGMGRVFLAQDTTLHRHVALKVPDSPAEGESARAHLLREARNAAALNHPNICAVYEVGEADGRAFIAMEYVEGRPLSDRLAESAMPWVEAVGYGVEAADALAYAHDHGVVHRDLKAANAIITTTGRLKLVDFGLARREDVLLADATTMPTLVATGAAVGTPYSMAPEQVRGGVTDARTDIWALGVLLYEMVSGGKPFGAVTIPELFSSILRDAPAPLPNGVPVDVQAVIERCLEKEPDRRYHRAEEVRARLEAIQAGTIPLWATWQARTRRHPWMTAAAAGIALITLFVAAGVGGVRERFSGSPVAEDPIKLAVLPFENLTGDPEQEYFSDGLTEEMITQLGRLNPQTLRVIARTSSMRYKHRDVPVDQIGRELGVDYVLEGSARREGPRVRISATLVRVRDQAQHWTDSFDREIAGILTLQGDVARGIARSLALTLLPEEQLRLASTRPVNPEAYEAYLKGHFHAQKETPADHDLALKYFEAALTSDSNYAPAYAGIAFVWTARNQNGYVTPGEATPRVKAAATKAAGLDPTQALAHYALGMAAWNEWDWETNEREFRRALEIDPTLADVRAYYSHLLIALKRPQEAVFEAERAMQLDPLNAFNQALYGTVLYVARRYDEAIAQFRNALKASPDMSTANCGLWRALSRTGRDEQALMAAERCHENLGLEVKDALARGRSARGYPEAMRRVADLLAARTGTSREYVSPLVVFSAYIEAGEKDLALDWLSKSVEARDPNVYGAVRNPLSVDSLGDDPRFRALVLRTGLPM